MAERRAWTAPKATYESNANQITVWAASRALHRRSKVPQSLLNVIFVNKN